MSPQPIPITTGKRAPVVHYALDGVALCGRRGVKLSGNTGTWVTCKPCRRMLGKRTEMEAQQYALRQELAALREGRARMAYNIWAHRATHGVAPGFEVLGETMRQGWREVVEYFEDELITEDE